MCIADKVEQDLDVATAVSSTNLELPANAVTKGNVAVNLVLKGDICTESSLIQHNVKS